MEEKENLEEIQMDEAQKRREEELNKSLFTLMRESISKQKDLGLLRGAQARDEAKKAVEDVKSKVDTYIDNASNGYADRKGKTDAIKQQYAEIAQDFADSYKRHMDMHNINRQEHEAQINDDRCKLAEANQEKIKLESTPIYKKYSSMVRSSEAQIARAAKAGDLEEVKRRTEELESYKSDFASSPVGKKYNENQENIAQLKQSIKDAKDAIQEIKSAEKEAKAQFKFDKKEIAGEKSTQLAKVEKKQGKLKDLIGRIAAKFSGEKGFNKRVLEPLKEKLKSAKEALPKIKEAMQNRQRDTIQRATGITSRGKELLIKGKDAVKDKFKSLKEKAQTGIRAVTTKISDAKTKVVNAAKNKLIDSKEKANEKIQQIEADRNK